MLAMLATQSAQTRQRTTKTTHKQDNAQQRQGRTTQPPIRDMFAMLEVQNQNNAEQPTVCYAYQRYLAMYARQGAQTRQPV